MTTVYFIRHAESDISVRDGRVRPLTTKGMADRALVTAFLSDKHIAAVVSSPFKRAVDTVRDFADKNGYDVEIIEDFREQKSSGAWDREADFWGYLKRMWADFDYKSSDAESLNEVQARNVAALNGCLEKYRDKTIVIGTHGTALSTIINHYDKTYGFENFKAMLSIMPWVVKMDFDGQYCIGMETTDLFHPEVKYDYDNCRVYTAAYGADKKPTGENA